MITKKQYLEIIDVFEKYIEARTKMFPNKPLSEEFTFGFTQAMTLIESLVEKDKKDQIYERE